MHLKRNLKWLIGLGLLAFLFLAARSWTSPNAEARSRQAAGGPGYAYLPLIQKDPTPTPTPVPTEIPPPPTCLRHHGEYELELYDLINHERTSRGLSALIPNGALETSAGWHSDDMALNDFISHTGSDGSTVLSRTHAAGWTTNWVAEVIMHSNTPQEAVDWWMSEGPGGPHYDTILGNLTHFGTGYAYCEGRWGGYFTVDFGHL